MSNKNRKFWLLPCILSVWPLAINAEQDEQEFLTLFTTKQERRFIDNNRYRQPEPEIAEIELDKEAPEQEASVSYHQYKAIFELAGVTLSEDGNHFAWVNGVRVKNGDDINDGVRIYISPKLSNLVQVKTPDGVHHNLEAGKKIEVKYMKPEDQ